VTAREEEIHVSNERRFTRLEILVYGLYLLILGMKVTQIVLTPGFVFP
jgi:hypothetical protein